MPLSAKGETIMEKLVAEHGEEEGKRIFYAMKASGKISGVDAMASKRRRKVQSYDPRGREAGSYEEEDSQFKLPLVQIVDAPARMMYDAVAFDDDAKLEFTSDGYMKAQPRIARTGIQLYKGDECGRPDTDVVRVYRPESSVFRHDAMHSYTHLPITIEHPGVPVTADNWKKVSVGETGDEVIRDGGTVRVPMMLRDAAAIKLVKDGKRQLSVGYACDLTWSDGVSPDGEKYDAIQHNIRGNHLAIVSQARGGPSLAIGDTKMEKTLLVDGLPCQMTDNAAIVVQRTLQKLQDENEFFKKKFAKKKEEEEEEEAEDAAAIKAKDAEIAKRDGQIVALEQQVKDAKLTPEQVDKLVDARLAIRDQSRKLLPTFKTDGKSDADIRRAVVASRLGDERAKAMSDENIEGAYQAYASEVATKRDPIADARSAFAGNDASQTNPKIAAYNEMVRDMENAWKTPA